EREAGESERAGQRGGYHHALPGARAWGTVSERKGNHRGYRRAPRPGDVGIVDVSNAAAERRIRLRCGVAVGANHAAGKASAMAVRNRRSAAAGVVVLRDTDDAAPGDQAGGRNGNG